MEERSTGRDGASPARRRPQAQEKTAARQSPAGGRELEQVASTAQASHTATTLRTRAAVPTFSSPKAISLTDLLNASAWLQRKNLGTSPAFRIGLMAGDGKPKGTQDRKVPCTTANHQLPLRTSLTAWTLTQLRRQLRDRRRDQQCANLFKSRLRRVSPSLAQMREFWTCSRYWDTPSCTFTAVRRSERRI